MIVGQLAGFHIDAEGGVSIHAAADAGVPPVALPADLESAPRIEAIQKYYESNVPQVVELGLDRSAKYSSVRTLLDALLVLGVRRVNVVVRRVVGGYGVFTILMDRVLAPDVWHKKLGDRDATTVRVLAESMDGRGILVEGQRFSRFEEALAHSKSYQHASESFAAPISAVPVRLEPESSVSWERMARILESYDFSDRDDISRGDREIYWVSGLVGYFPMD